MFRVITALYGNSHDPYATVLIESLRRVGHDDVRIMRLAIDPDTDRRDRVAQKLTAWNDGLDDCQDGDDVVFLDADTMVMKPLTPVFQVLSFDVAHTIRHDRRWPINSGVVFVKASLKTRRWFRAWRDLSAWAYESEERNQTAVGLWGHVDQATLPASLAMHRDLQVTELPAQIWNEDRVSEAPDDVAIFHLKGVLDLLLKPYEDTDRGDQRLRKDQFEAWRAFYADAT